jgi:hypothetical protein
MQAFRINGCAAGATRNLALVGFASAMLAWRRHCCPSLIINPSNVDAQSAPALFYRVTALSGHGSIGSPRGLEKVFKAELGIVRQQPTL